MRGPYVAGGGGHRAGAFDVDVGDQVLGGVEARQQCLPLCQQCGPFQGRGLAAEQAGVVELDLRREQALQPRPVAQVGEQADAGDHPGDLGVRGRAGGPQRPQGAAQEAEPAHRAASPPAASQRRKCATAASAAAVTGPSAS